MVRRAASKASTSVDRVSRARASAPATIRLAWPPAGTWRRSSLARSSAEASRSGAPSLACMEAEASTTKIVCSASSASPRRTGRAISRPSTRAASTWAASSQLGISRCQGRAADTGVATRRHRNTAPPPGPGCGGGAARAAARWARPAGPTAAPTGWPDPSRRGSRSPPPVISGPVPGRGPGPAAPVPARRWSTPARRPRRRPGTRPATSSAQRWASVRYSASTEAVSDTSSRAPVSTSTSSRSPLRSGSRSVGSSTWITASSPRRAGSRRIPASHSGVSRSDTTTVMPGRAGLGQQPVGGRHQRGLAPGLQGGQVAEQAHGGSPAPEAGARPVEGEGVDAHHVAAHQGAETEGGRQLGRPMELGPRHRGRRVDQEPQGQLVLGVEQLDQQAVEAGQGVEVDAAKVVARVVLPEVGEVERRAVAGRTVLTGQPAGQAPPVDQLQPFQPGQQPGRQQVRPVAHRPTTGSGRGTTTVEVVLRRENGQRLGPHGAPRTPDLGSPTCSSTEVTRSSALRPSAVAS